MSVTCYILTSVFQFILPLNYKGIEGKAVHLQDVGIGLSDTEWISLSTAKPRYWLKSALKWEWLSSMAFRIYSTELKYDWFWSLA